MNRGFYLASNGLINQQRTIDTIANNMANSQTAGYKRDLSVQNTFKRELILLNQGRKNKTGTFEYKYTDKSYTQLEQGSFEFSGSPLDVAIDGPVYFNVENADEEAVLTRNGQFCVDSEGYLSLDGVGRVLCEDGPLKVDGSNFEITNSGEVTVDGDSAGRLSLTYISENDNVEKQGDNTFKLIVDKDDEINDGEQTNNEIPEGTEYNIIQGAFERSNVDVAVELTRSMSAQRSFESLSQAIKMLDSVNEIAANKLSKIN